MKMKGIDLLEKHVEKIVLAATVVLLVAVGTMQFITEPNAVKVGADTVSPDEVDRQLRQKADQLDTQLRSDRAVDLPPVESVEELFRQRRQLSLVETERTIPWGRPYHISIEGGAGPLPDDARFAELELMPLDAPLVAADVFNIDPLQFAENELLAAQFDPGAPTDLRAVTIEATLDTEDLRAALNVGRDDENLQAIPLSWYENDLYIVDVVVERQKRLEDGSWSEPAALPTLPGRPSVREQLNAEAKPPLEEFIKTRNERAYSIERPAFYDVRTNPWRKPSELAARAQAQTQEPVQLTPIGRVEAQIERVFEQIAGVEEQKQAVNEQIKREQERDTGRTTSRTDNPRIEALRRRVEGFDARIQALRDEIAKLEERALAIDPNWESPFGRSGERRDERDEEELPFGGRGGEGPQPGPRKAAEAETLLERDSVPLWAHDVNVEPGATYRYRLSYAVLNPFVDKATRLSEQQQHLAESLAVYSEPSAWSDPVEVPAAVYYFVTAASPPQQGTPVARASVKLYEYYEGFWRHAEASLEPGDELEKTVSVKVLAPPAAPGGRQSNTEDVQSVNLTLSIPVTLLDVVERPIKRESELGTPIVDYEAVLAEGTGRITLRTPHLDALNPALGWLDQMVEQGRQLLESRGG